MILDEKKNGGTVVHRDLRPNDEMNPDFESFQMSSNDAVNAIAVGDSKPGKPKPISFLDELLRMTRTFQKGTVRFTPQRDVRG